MTPKAVALSYRILVRAQAIKLHVTNILNTDWTRMLRTGIHTVIEALWYVLSLVNGLLQLKLLLLLLLLSWCLWNIKEKRDDLEVN